MLGILQLLLRTVMVLIGLVYFANVFNYYSSLHDKKWDSTVGCVENDDAYIPMFYYGIKCVKQHFELRNYDCNKGCFLSSDKGNLTCKMVDYFCNYFHREKDFSKFINYVEKKIDPEERETKPFCFKDCSFLALVNIITFASFVLTPLVSILLIAATVREWMQSCSGEEEFDDSHRIPLIGNLKEASDRLHEKGLFSAAAVIIPYYATPLIDGMLLLHRVLNNENLEPRNVSFDINFFFFLSLGSVIGWFWYPLFRICVAASENEDNVKCFKGMSVIVGVPSSILTACCIGLGIYIKVNSFLYYCTHDATTGTESVFQTSDVLLVIVIMVNLVISCLRWRTNSD